MATQTDPRDTLHGEPEETPLFGPDSPASNQNTPSGDGSDPRGPSNPRAVYDPQTTPLNDASDPRGSKAASKQDISSAENNPSRPNMGETTPEEQANNKNTIGDGFNPANKFLPAPVKAALLFKNLFSGKNGKRNSAVAGLTSGSLGLLMVFFMTLGPLKTEFVVQNLQNRFFAAPSEALDEVSRHLLIKYMAQRVLPGYKSCGTTKSLKCASKKAGSKNPVSSLFNVWAEQRFENKLANKYGIEFVHDTAADTWKLKAPGINGDGEDIGRNGEKLATVTEHTERSSFRNATSSALKAETHWYQVWLRYRVGRLVEKKYGVKRCLIYCGSRDQVADFGNSSRRVSKLYLTERVILPRNESLGIVLSCLFDPTCNPEKTEPTAQGDGLNGEPENPKVDTAVRTTLEQRAASYGQTSPEAVERLKKDYETIQEKGYSKFLITKVFTKLGFEKAGQVAAGAVPIAGWVVAGSQTISALNNAGPAIKKLGYVTNSAAAVGVFSMYRTYADETHTGHVDPEHVGSFSKSLDGGNNGGENDPLVGGTASAEESPLYEKWILGHDNATTSTSSLLGKAYAQGASKNSSNYVCQDGKPVPTGSDVCSEEVFGGGSASLNAVHDALNIPGVSIITRAADLVSSGLSALVGPIVSLFSNIPGVSDVASLVGSVFEPLFKKIINEVIPNPFSTNMGGGRTLHMAAAGADVAGNDACHQGLGCRKASDAEITALRNEYFNKEQAEFKNKTFFARMFDTSTQYSFVSRVALATSFDAKSSFQKGLTGIFTSPFKSFFNLFGAFDKKTLAASDAEADPFGISQYIFPREDIPDDPEAYWDDNNCGDTSENGPTYKWNKQAADGEPDKLSGMPVNTETNPCLLISGATTSLGAYYDSSMLSDDDKKVYGGEQPTQTSSVNGDVSELAQQILDESNIQKVGRYVNEDLQNTAEGKPSYGNVELDVNLLKFILDVGKESDKPLQITSITGDGCGHSSNTCKSAGGSSMHYEGKGVDIGCNGISGSLLDRIGRKYGVKSNFERCDAGINHYHFSTTGS